MTTNAKGAIVLLSGGMDSTVLLRHVAERLQRAPVHALSYNYGQRHAKELECAEWQAVETAVAEHVVINLSFLAAVLKSGTSLVEGGGEVPDLKDLKDGDLSQPPTYVPNRNMMLLSIAAAYAESHGFRDIYYGAQAHDEYGYWDCTSDFLERINTVLALNRKEPVEIHAPFVGLKKHELVSMGTDLGVDFTRTWSCYRGQETPCGTCPTCVERLKAFQEAGIRDPLVYAEA